MINSPENPIDVTSKILTEMVEKMGIPVEVLTLVACGLYMSKTIAIISSKSISESQAIDKMVEIKELADNLVENYLPLRVEYGITNVEVPNAVLAVALAHQITGSSPLMLVKPGEIPFDLDKDVPIKGSSFEQMMKDVFKKRRGE